MALDEWPRCVSGKNPPIIQGRVNDPKILILQHCKHPIASEADNFANEVVLGDGEFSLCDPGPAHPSASGGPPRKRWRSRGEDAQSVRRISGSDTNYSGFVEVQVWGPDGQILAKQSEYFKPVQTSSRNSPTMACNENKRRFSIVLGFKRGHRPPVRPTDSPMTFLFGVICGTILVVLVLILVICLIRRRNSCPYDGDDGEHLGLTALLRRTVHRSSHLARGTVSPVVFLHKLSY
ncbi:tyrosine-protein phosphatase 69D [Caerostris extrusa]|uniref:Tyrosine-protein phosphatase 69D n=1 Tax=Caerostris extrusa TaxID=172846 RepID=A0AAV4RWA5_CAEEX|nr:tyrosine-protein phosphatase 69D [Caerostris extrusa]